MKTDKKPINALYSCCLAEPWLEVAKKLDQELNIKPVYYIGWRNDTSRDITDLYPECFFQLVEDAWIGCGFPEDIDYRFSFDEDFMKSISYEKFLAIKMMDRLDLGRNSFSFANREIFFNRLLKYWMNIVETYNITMVISPSIPHRIFDYILYTVAKLKNIKFVIFQITPFSDSSFIIDQVEQTPTYLKEYIQTHQAEGITLRQDIQEKLLTLQKDYKAAVPSYMITQQKNADKLTFVNNMSNRIKNFIKNPLTQFEKDKSYYIMRPDDLPYQKVYYTYERKLLKQKNTHFIQTLQAQYASLAITPDYTKKYLFVALHYQPEANSVPTGGSFGDQTLIIELLHQFLDEDYHIYIKEHKTQIYPNHEGAMGRNKNYYQHLLSISDRVHLIKLDSDPFELIDNAVATVTISGTVGWEGINRGTPALVFGRAWYEDMPGAFKIKSLEDLRSNWETILKMKNNISPESIENYHKKLQHFLINAPLTKFLQGRVNRPNEENAHNIVEGIKKHFERIGYI